MTRSFQTAGKQAMSFNEFEISDVPTMVDDFWAIVLGQLLVLVEQLVVANDLAHVATVTIIGSDVHYAALIAAEGVARFLTVVHKVVQILVLSCVAVGPNCANAL